MQVTLSSPPIFSVIQAARPEDVHKYTVYSGTPILDKQRINFLRARKYRYETRDIIHEFFKIKALELEAIRKGNFNLHFRGSKSFLMNPAKKNEIITRLVASKDKRRKFSFLNTPLATVQVEGYNEKTKLKTNRITFCGSPLDKKDIPLSVNKENKAYLSNLTRCGNRWLCPVCQAKIAASLASDLTNAFYEYENQGYRLYFTTITIKHKKNQPLIELLTQVQKNWSLLTKNLRAFKDIQAYFMTLEITHTFNAGFHPHYHILSIHKKSDLTSLKKIVNKWLLLNDGSEWVGQKIKQAESGGLPNYITKLGLSFELSSNQSKNKNKDSLHPFEFLDCGMIDEFIEYAEATKGKNMNYYSKNFFTAVGLREKTEDERLDEGQKLFKKLGAFTNRQYVYLRKKIGVAKILQLAENGVNVEGINKIYEINHKTLSEYKRKKEYKPFEKKQRKLKKGVQLRLNELIIEVLNQKTPKKWHWQK